MIPTTSDDLLQPLTDGKVIMGLYPVLFGWRVRAGRVGEMVYHCDWCCGADEKTVWGTYGIMRVLLERFELTRLPMGSEVKPWTKDVKFIMEIADLLAGTDVPMVGERPSLTVMRAEYMRQFDKRHI